MNSPFLETLTPTRYQLDYYRRAQTGEVVIDVRIERVERADGVFRWVICERGLMLTRGGEWTNQHSLRAVWENAEDAARCWLENKCISHAEEQLRLHVENLSAPRSELFRTILTEIEAR